MTDILCFWTFLSGKPLFSPSCFLLNLEYQSPDTPKLCFSEEQSWEALGR